MKATPLVLILTLIPGRGECGELDKIKLRALVPLPKVVVYAELNYSGLFGISLNGEKVDPATEIARLQQPQKDAAAEAERYRRLARLYRRLDRETEAKEAGVKALAICRTQVREHPEDMRWLARLGDALCDEGELQEGEKLLRRVVKDAASDWRGWLALACCVDQKSLRAVLGEKHFRFHIKGEKWMIRALHDRRPTAEQIATMRRLSQEARGYYDRAVALGPRETQPYLDRISSRWIHAVIEGGLRLVKGEKIDLNKILLSPQCAADLAQVARLRPNDPQIIGAAALWEFLACVLHGKMKKADSFKEVQKEQSGPLTDFLSAESRDFIRWGTNRLIQLEKSADKKTAADAAEALVDLLLATKGPEDKPSIFPAGHRPDLLPAIYNTPNQDEEKKQKLLDYAEYLIYGDKGDPRRTVLEHLQRLVQLDPSRERAWDMLTECLDQLGNREGAVAICQKRIGLKDTAHNRFLLAAIYAERYQLDRADEQLRAGLKSDPKDGDCRLGLAAVLLKRGDAEALKQAGDQLDSAEARIKEEKDDRRWLNHLLLRGLHAALSDRPKQAKEWFEQVLRRDKGNPSAARGWAILGDHVGPPNAQIAADYIRANKGVIRYNRKQPGSPVTEVRFNDDKWTDDDLYFLSAFPSLRYLDIFSKSITDAGMVHLKKLTALRGLDLDYTSVTDAGMVHLEGLRELTSIWIDCSPIDEVPAITDIGLAHLRKLPKLQDVTLHLRLTDKGLTHIATLPRLKRLYAGYSKITDEGMSHFEKCAELRELHINGGIFTDAGLAHLKGLRKLRELDLDKAKITDAGLAHLEGLKTLEKLRLSDTIITDAGLVHLRKLTNLRKLELQGNSNPFERHTLNERKKPGVPPRITDAGLKPLQALTKLEELNLNDHPITDAGLVSLKGLNNLRSLSLKGSAITDAGLKLLHGWKQLKSLDLSETKVTREGIAELRKALPKLEISQ